MSTNDKKVHYLKKEFEAVSPPSIQLEDIPGRARNSFRKSLENAIISQTVTLEYEALSGDFIDEEFISKVMHHLKNKARYGPVWAEYVFEVPDSSFEEMIKRILEQLKNRKPPVSIVNLYKHLAKKLKREEWLLVPEDYLMFNYRYNLLFEEHEKTRKPFKR